MSGTLGVADPNEIEGDENKKKVVEKIPLFWKLVVGAAAGFVGTCCIYPLDMVKTRLQSNAAEFSGPIDCATKIYQRRGIRGFYGGLKVNLIGVLPEKAIKLAANSTFREYFEESNGDNSIKLYQEMIAGAGAGFCQVIATNPMELLKIRVQLENAKPNKADRKPLSAIFNELGVAGCYKGTASTLLRDVPFSLIFFPLYANIVNMMKDENGNASLLSQLFAGSIAGAVGSGAVTPFDVIKTRLQMKGGITMYGGIVGAFNTIRKEEGWVALRRGAIPRMCVVGPLFGITLLAYELQKQYYMRL